MREFVLLESSQRPTAGIKSVGVHILFVEVRFRCEGGRFDKRFDLRGLNKSRSKVDAREMRKWPLS